MDKQQQLDKWAHSNSWLVSGIYAFVGTQIDKVWPPIATDQDPNPTALATAVLWADGYSVYPLFVGHHPLYARVLRLSTVPYS